jgi:hypothetical protein
MTLVVRDSFSVFGCGRCVRRETTGPAGEAGTVATGMLLSGGGDLTLEARIYPARRFLFRAATLLKKFASPCFRNREHAASNDVALTS